jgi:predicted PurR-regulated permease PerM
MGGDLPVERFFAVVQALPWLGEPLADLLRSMLQSPAEAGRQALEWIRDRAGRVFVIAGGLGRNLMTLLLMLLTLYFIYRDGERWIVGLQQIVQRLFGDDGRAYLATVRAATRAVVYGLLATMLAQGTLAGIGFWAAGVPAPTLLALTTALFALLPFGPAVPIGAAVLWLALSGAVVPAIGLALWGTLAVGLVDNLLRPLVMSKGVRLHYLLALFGVLGGMMLFGLIGVFVGPIVLAVITSLLRKWLGEHAPRSGGRRGRHAAG